ncbi:helix-turn-helix domain-containing protein [Rhodococcus sp. IEGM 1379]|uniref:helix-turn-helix domain-containing protein n=1 Tax=Rhodococcus sp. IEGM 1379 TaxID=3047086 RepID=UPI0024B868A0|nr:helix-turn-helix domain-containing protein [Rhodococcus sp. IEGM 1379]MDI9916735.1 helix-turn-helix domain-containing protein [Rhodococcus sp. IEGM 1379]
MTATGTFNSDGSRAAMTSLEQTGHGYAERPIEGGTELFNCLWKSMSSHKSTNAPKRIIPDLCADFIVDNTGKSWLVGPATTADLVTVTPGTTLWGIRINPPSLRSILGTEADGVKDSKISFADVLSSKQSRLLAEALRTERVDARMLEGLLPSAHRDTHAITGYTALTSAPNTSIREITADLGISERHFRRTITASVGLSPKMIQKVQRLQNVLTLARRENTSLSALAARTGYADQAHLSRDVQALAGITPTLLLRDHG